MTINTMLPPKTKKAVDGIPIIGQIMSFPKAEFEIFYGCLIMSEALFICICHYWAWNASEEWYEQAQGEDEDIPVDYRYLEPPNPSYDRVALSARTKSSYG